MYLSETSGFSPLISVPFSPGTTPKRSAVRCKLSNWKFRGEDGRKREVGRMRMCEIESPLSKLVFPRPLGYTMRTPKVNHRFAPKHLHRTETRQ